MPTPVQKRMARFEAAQAALSPEQLELQAQQNRTSSKPKLSKLTILEHEKSEQWFREFMQHQHPDVDVDQTFFTPGNAVNLTFPVFKEYARYLSRSRLGQLSEKPTVMTIRYYTSMIMEIVERKSLSRLYHIRKEVHDFVGNELAEQEGLQRLMHPKAVAFSADVTFILSKMYEPQFLATFSNMRTVLNLTLYINLIIDLCGRGGEIARHPLKEKHMCLHWEDIEFYTFRNKDQDELDIRMNIKVRWSKNHTLDDWKYKTIPFPRLLPNSMALEDSLRLILNLALMDEVFEDGINT